VLPKGLQRVGDYGFLHGNAKRLKVRIQVILLHLINWKILFLAQQHQAKQYVFVLAASINEVRWHHAIDLAKIGHNRNNGIHIKSWRC